ncbi:hypothetical protein JYB64_09110 [Algoriphagus aestuarii]|nr:hypothetical protein [Algoriphagus aestuarii]
MEPISLSAFRLSYIYFKVFRPQGLFQLYLNSISSKTLNYLSRREPISISAFRLSYIYFKVLRLHGLTPHSTSRLPTAPVDNFMPLN